VPGAGARPTLLPVLTPDNGAAAPVPFLPVPRLRGRLHQVAAVAAVPAAAAAVTGAPTVGARSAAAVYGGSLMALFSVSSAYHRGRWSPSRRRLLKRLDHTTIYAFAAASYTPMARTLPGRAAPAFLTAVWGGAALGSAVKWVQVDTVGGLADVIYTALGWSGLLVLPLLLQPLSTAELGLLLGGGVVYSAGAAVMLTRRPDPRPESFGYHELGHAVMLGGTVAHYLLNRRLLARA
jgi:hemolysin III